MRLVPPPPELPDDKPVEAEADVDTNTGAAETGQPIRSQPIPPLHLVPSAALVVNAAHMQYVAANVYAGKDKGK